MSGLTVFFHSFLPKGSFPTYDQSTATLRERQQQGYDRGDEVRGAQRSGCRHGERRRMDGTRFV